VALDDYYKQHVAEIKQHGDCPNCEHPLHMHYRASNGAYACRYFGCGCRDIELEAV
jgi:hypothetical protein